MYDSLLPNGILFSLHINVILTHAQRVC